MIDHPGDVARLGKVVAEDLDDQIAVRTGQLVEYAVDHRLRETDLDAGQFAKALGHLGDQLLLVHPRGPGVVGVQRDSAFDVRRRPRIGAVVVAPELRDDVLDLLEFERSCAHLTGHLARLLK